ncbi:alanine dehydrogenase [Methylophaga sp. OBS1]|uniref:alanine dehydrogenase n=1 Tax=Methylophaga sp. OBS1 TaxID=2991933 RepID=UPI00224FF617|nr:alanine dehydrogenase [Methylophaga sp. OBS1]MCX4193175.1 alanine dehydrogenase [Methylophaga sp. OBS1]
MLIGVPREIKNHEYRVGLTPAGVRELSKGGHQVLIETDAGTEIGLSNEDYRQAGAELVDEVTDLFKRAELIIKVKEPLTQERALLRSDQTLFTYLHLAPDAEQTRELVGSGATCIAYETVTDTAGGLPLLAPMSEVAGRMAIQAAAHALEKTQGGMGVLIGGVPGVSPANVAVIGGGVVGINAARMAMGLGANVTILDKSIPRLKALDEQFGPQLKTLYTTSESIEQAALSADIVIGAVLLPGAKAPKLISREMLKQMKNGSVLVDVSIDQGGCFENSRPTTHDEPIYIDEGVIHYCVANMPGAVARTSTFALTNATLPFVLALANKGVNNALKEDPHLLAGLNVYRRQMTYQAVAEAHGYDYVSPETVLRD